LKPLGIHSDSPAWASFLSRKIPAWCAADQLAASTASQGINRRTATMSSSPIAKFTDQRRRRSGAVRFCGQRTSVIPRIVTSDKKMPVRSNV